MKIYPCYQCGYCCTVSACGYGEWDAEKHQCKFLTEESKCARHAEIVEQQKGFLLPMMGSGCSSPMFNQRREAKMREAGEDPAEELKEMEKELGISLDFSDKM